MEKQKLFDYMLSLHPALDRENKFVFFSNSKVLQTSLIRTLLKQRSVVSKDNVSVYDKKFKSYSFSDFENMFKFTIVRNPFDRTVSAFFYLQNMKIIPANQKFKDFIKRDFNKVGTSYNPHFTEQYKRVFYTNQFVDFVGRFENINKDWKHIASKIDFDVCLKLPHKNKTKHEHYRTYYDNDCLSIVSNVYKKDLEYFDYSF